MSGFIHRLPSRLHLTRVWRAVHRSSVPVLLFHGVLPDADTSPFNATGKFISPRRLRSYLTRIARTFRIISIEDLISRLREKRETSNVMVITFDDGYANVHTHALPLLCEMELPFSVFVTTGLVGTKTVLWTDMVEYAVSKTSETVLPRGVLPHDAKLDGPAARRDAIALVKNALKDLSAAAVAERMALLREVLRTPPDAPELDDVRFLSEEQIKDMVRRGVVFGGHSVTHPILSRETPDRIRSEVRGCKSALEAFTGGRVEYFAYPNGRRQDFNDTVKRELKEAGFCASLTTIHGLHHPGDDLFEIRRIAVDNRWAYEEFETRVSGILKALRR
jgi:peptidoglycan/xylan/chitin deacetylase (PgdA/CDA1 family)